MTFPVREAPRRTRYPLAAARTLAPLPALLLGLIVAGGAFAEAPPGVGDRAPDFSFQGSDGKTYTLQGLLEGGRRGIVLAFFPKAFTPG